MASTSQAPKHSKSGKGRKKVRMEKMKNEANLQVTFTKRRCGLFKKASELCTLTGCDIGIIVFSPKRNVFSFGHPSVHKVMENLFPSEGYDEKLTETHTATRVMEQNMHLSTLQMQMDMEKQFQAVVEGWEKEEMAGHKPIKEMTESELVELRARLNALKRRIMSAKTLMATSLTRGLPT
ncbi:hypothetical protein V2J09_020630 [Rumex salicifolius]